MALLFEQKWIAEVEIDFYRDRIELQPVTR
jgi:hypothetical protein